MNSILHNLVIFYVPTGILEPYCEQPVLPRRNRNCVFCALRRRAHRSATALLAQPCDLGRAARGCGCSLELSRRERPTVVSSGSPLCTALQLPRAVLAVKPWLREHVTDARFWDGEWDTTHTGEYALPEPTEDDRAAMFERYAAQPNPLEGKDELILRSSGCDLESHELIGVEVLDI